VKFVVPASAETISPATLELDSALTLVLNIRLITLTRDTDLLLFGVPGLVICNRVLVEVVLPTKQAVSLSTLVDLLHLSCRAEGEFAAAVGTFVLCMAEDPRPEERSVAQEDVEVEEPMLVNI